MLNWCLRRMSDYMLSFEDDNSQTMRGDAAEAAEADANIGFGSSVRPTSLCNGMLSRSSSNEEQSSNNLRPPNRSKFHSLPNRYPRDSSSKAGGLEKDSSMHGHLNHLGPPEERRPTEKTNDLHSPADNKMTFQRARELFRTMESSLDKCTRYRQECLPVSNRCMNVISNQERSIEYANVLPPLPPSSLNNESKTSFVRNGFTLNNCFDRRDIQLEKGRSRPGSLSSMDESTLRGTVVDLPSIKDANANTVSLPESPSNRTSGYPPVLPKPKHYQKCRVLPLPTTDHSPTIGHGPLADHCPTIGHSRFTDHCPTIGHGPLTDHCPTIGHSRFTDHSSVTERRGISTEINASVVQFLKSRPKSECSAVQMNDSVYTNDSVQNNQSDRWIKNSQDLDTDVRNNSDILESRTENICDRGLKRGDDSG